MTKKQQKAGNTFQGVHPCVTALIPAAHADREAAFRLGFKHGFDHLRLMSSEQFATRQTAVAYDSGVQAGRAARAIPKIRQSN